MGPSKVLESGTAGNIKWKIDKGSLISKWGGRPVKNKNVGAKNNTQDFLIKPQEIILFYIYMKL